MNALHRPHAHYEELVAGHALYALEPEDEQELLRHLQGCASCQRDLQAHRDTLGHLAHVGDDAEPPPGLWDAIRREVVAESGPQAFASRPVPTSAPPATSSAASSSGSAVVPPAPVADLAAARGRRPGRHRAAAWVSVAAAALAVFAAAGVWTERDRQGELSRELQDQVSALQTAPARDVRLTDDTGEVQAVALVQPDRLSLVVDGLPRNDVTSTCYVLWGRTGSGPVRALAVFDVRDDLDVVRDVPYPASDGAPDLLLVTREAGRTAPAVTAETPLVTGRAA